MQTTNLSTLKIHKLTQEQYERELAAGRIDPNALYLTPGETECEGEGGGAGSYIVAGEWHYDEDGNIQATLDDSFNWQDMVLAVRENKSVRCILRTSEVDQPCYLLHLNSIDEENNEAIFARSTYSLSMTLSIGDEGVNHISLESMSTVRHGHSASDIFGGTLREDCLPIVPIDKGGTGATTAEQAREALGITPANIGAASIEDIEDETIILNGNLSITYDENNNPVSYGCSVSHQAPYALVLDAIADNKAVICRLKVRNVEDTYVDLIPINTSLESGVIEFASVPTSDGQYVLKLTPETDYLSVGISKVTSEPPYQVGDILTTLRTDLDDTWLLCNGQAVANSEIDSRLYECTSPSSINGGSVVFNHACAHSVRTNKLCSMNGYLVMIANDYDGTDYLAQIAYTTDPAQGWTTKCIAKSNSNTCAITGIASSGAQWAVCLLDGSIYYATTPDGAWSKGATDGVSRSLYCITYDGEFWMVGGAESTKAVAARFTNLSASPSFVTIWNNATSAGAITCIERHNGVFICGGLYHERKDDNTQIYAPRVACGSSLSTMNQKNLVEYSSAPTVRDVVRGISYHNGQWVVVGGGARKEPDSSYVIWYATTFNPFGEWYHSMLSSSPSASSGYDIININGTWYYICVYNGEVMIRYGRTLGRLSSGTITTLGGSISNMYTAAAICYHGTDIYVSVSKTQATSVYKVVSTKRNLPIISTEGAYTYIKAKED